MRRKSWNVQKMFSLKQNSRGSPYATPPSGRPPMRGRRHTRSPSLGRALRVGAAAAQLAPLHGSPDGLPRTFILPAQGLMAADLGSPGMDGFGGKRTLGESVGANKSGSPAAK